MTAYVQPILPAREARDHMIDLIRQQVGGVGVTAASFGREAPSLREELVYAHAINPYLQDEATRRLRTACRDRALTMVVCDPQSSTLRPVPPAYFKTDRADIEFEQDFFHGYELTEKLRESILRDAAYKQVVLFIGWPHGFDDTEFREWLNDPEIGPESGLRFPSYVRRPEGIEGISDNLSGVPGLTDQSTGGTVESPAKLAEPGSQPATEHAVAASKSARAERGAYTSHLSDFMTRKGYKWVEATSALDIAKNYITHHQRLARAGKEVPNLPDISNRTSRIAIQVQKIRARMANQEAENVKTKV